MNNENKYTNITIDIFHIDETSSNVSGVYWRCEGVLVKFDG